MSYIEGMGVGQVPSPVCKGEMNATLLFFNLHI